MLKVVVCLVFAVVMVNSIPYDTVGSFCCNPPRTFEGKIKRIMEFYDSDLDGFITNKDRDRDLILYDINGDCSVSVYEWVSVWSCRYGDTPDKAFQIFNTVTQGATSLSFEDLRNSPVNLTLAQAEATVRNFYSEMA